MGVSDGTSDIKGVEGNIKGEVVGVGLSVGSDNGTKLQVGVVDREGDDVFFNEHG